MNKLKHVSLKNAMFLANFVANAIGVTVVLFLSRHIMVSPLAAKFQETISRIDLIILPLSFLLPIAIVLCYEKPIRRYLNLKYIQKPVLEEMGTQARRRLLNEPFFFIAMDLGLWLGAAIVYTTTLWILHAPKFLVFQPLFMSLQTGLITTAAAFFLLEHVLQRHMAPHFFPDGGLYMTPRTLRIRISTRLGALVFACNLVPFIAILSITFATFQAYADPSQILRQLRFSILQNAILFMGVGISLALLVGGNLRRPLEDIIRVLQGVRNARFDDKVLVRSNDEIGYTGDIINEMTEGLIERDKMRSSLALAMEVQQNLLPKGDPSVEGLDIAGASIYCDETGGDYYDFLEKNEIQQGRISIVIGDVTGHGIQSALLMATARALVRQRSSLPGGIGDIITDVNQRLSHDVGDSGRFMTLFYLNISLEQRRLEWVRAGHDPAIFYDPATDALEELYGAGMALGFDESWQYEVNRKSGLRKGQIIFMGTDGIWEARNSKGEMFGKERIHDIIRQKAASKAGEIQDAVIDALKRFQGACKSEDDVTLVVIKIMAD